MHICSCRTIGVVGVDATLEEIENFLNRHQWGTVYSFLMNMDGETIFHPRLKPSETVFRGGAGRGRGSVFSISLNYRK